MLAIRDGFPSVLRRHPRAAATYKPRLEALEDRRLLSVSAATLDLGGVFVRYNDGELFLHDPTGFRKIDINVASVSAGFSVRGGTGPVPVAFIVYNNAQLFEWAQDTGFQMIDSNVASVAGGSIIEPPDTVFILYNNGELFRHVGTSPLSGFTFIAGAVTSMSAVCGAFGNGDVFYVQSNNILSEHLFLGGSTVIDGNVQSVSSGQLEPDSAYILYTNSALFFFNPAATQRFTPIDTNVASVAGSESTAPGGMVDVDAAFYVTRDGVLAEWLPPSPSGPSPDGTYIFIDANVASISTASGISTQSGGLDDVFIVYNNGMLFQHTGLSRRSGFTFIDSNVSP
jgi:hypothetical protein